jgi:hypothetical protein
MKLLWKYVDSALRIVTSERFAVQYCFMIESINSPFKITTKERLEEVVGIKCINGFYVYI